MMKTKNVKNDGIEIKEVQDERIWIHSFELGYGHWITNAQLKQLLETKTKEQKG